jgi:hypothetical protein
MRRKLYREQPSFVAINPQVKQANRLRDWVKTRFEAGRGRFHVEQREYRGRRRDIGRVGAAAASTQ